MNIGVILAAGDSKRFGGYMHKQYLKINGMEMVAYSIRAMQKSVVDDIVVVVDKDEYEEQYIAKKYNVKCILGGDTRNESISLAIKYIRESYECKRVLFHDSVRPLITSKKIDKYFEQLDNYDAVVTYSKINDALVDQDNNNIRRDSYELIQTPEAFRFDVLDNFNPLSRDLAIVSQVYNAQILKLQSDVFNMKITYPEELFIAEQLMRLNYYSINHNDKFEIKKLPSKVLLLGASGGVGQAIKEYLDKNAIVSKTPRHSELDMRNMSVKDIQDYLGDFVPDAIINAAAAYYDDNDGLSKTFDDIFAVNVKANEILIEYALTVGKKINVVLMSSSSSTKGRKNITNYSAAKAALNSIVESQAESLVMQNVYLNAVIPEKVNTPLIEKLHKTKINNRELLEPKDVINAIMYLASSDEYGQLVHIRKGL